ncbi:MAG: tetratricopeptide repeat protein [Acidobacteria bacterium]|nr:tetratricopeptide repeat protein [Acidobacteriota bacterium]
MLLPILLAFANPCQPCHPQIVQSYEKTAMARSSSKHVTNLKSSEPFLDPITQTTFSITPGFLLKFSKPNQFEGFRQLSFAIGSGRVGHSFLFKQGNRLFQAPVSYYSETRQYQLSPGFQRRPQLDLTRVVEPSCLNCHTTAFNPVTLDITPGIGCERCHGNTARHLATAGKGPIVNPKKLNTHERDSICAQCHLTGAARVARYRPSGDTYKPGLNLSNFSAIFTEPQSGDDNSIGVTSHYESLSLSQCRLPDNQPLSCTTCHDPHSEPPDATTYFNNRCQSCHDTKPCKQTNDTNCISCHMPKASGRGVDHSSYTNHSIPRDKSPRQPASKALTPFWADSTNDRDLGLAQAILNRIDQAQPLLEAAAKANPKDLTVLSQLAQIHDRQGREANALPLYEAILKLDPAHPTASTNLAVIRAKAGRLSDAISLWRTALKSNPAQTGVRMNLAQALLRQGNRAAAIEEIKTALSYDPDQPAARRILTQLQ